MGIIMFSSLYKAQWITAPQIKMWRNLIKYGNTMIPEEVGGSIQHK